MAIFRGCKELSFTKEVGNRPVSVLGVVLMLGMFPFVWQWICSAQSPEIREISSSAEPAERPSPFPAGTVLPMRLEGDIVVKETQKGQAIAARITQDVPLPDKVKIPIKSMVRGSVVSVQKDPEGEGVLVTLKFNQLEMRKEAPVTISTYLRAMASYSAVRAAQTPRSGADVGTPTGWADTTQIGGDTRFGDGGEVRGAGKQNVGKGVLGGVLVHVKANPARGCEGPVNGDDHLQALWVFSANACGVYDLKGTKIAHTGKSAPIGEFSLHFEKIDMKLEDGTAFLLRISPQP